MEQATDHSALLGKLVVALHGGRGLLDVDGDPSLSEELQRVGGCAKSKVMPASEDDDLAAAIKKLLYVGRLDAGLVAGPGFVPVPGSPHARPHLDLLSKRESLDAHSSP